MQTQFKLLLLLLATFIMIPIFAGKGGADRSAGDALPPIEYISSKIKLPRPTTAAWLNDLTDSGVVVGRYIPNDTEAHAWLYDPIIDPRQAIDLNDLSIQGFDSTNWVISSAVGANNNRLVVGYTRLRVAPSIRRGFVLDLASEPIQMYELPDSDWTNTSARDVSDNGDIMGVYDTADAWGIYLVNPGLRDGTAYDIETPDFNVITPDYAAMNNPVAGSAPVVVGRLATGGLLSYTRGSGKVHYLDPSLSHPEINDYGDIASAATIQKKIPAKGANTKIVTSCRIFRDVGGIAEYPLDSPWTIHVRGINNSATVCFTSDTDYFYHDTYGVVNLASLVRTSELPSPGTSRINSVGVLGFSQVSGLLTDPVTDEKTLLIMTPVKITSENLAADRFETGGQCESTSSEKTRASRSLRGCLTWTLNLMRGT